MSWQLHFSRQAWWQTKQFANGHINTSRSDYVCSESSNLPYTVLWVHYQVYIGCLVWAQDTGIGLCINSYLKLFSTMSKMRSTHMISALRAYIHEHLCGSISPNSYVSMVSSILCSAGQSIIVSAYDATGQGESELQAFCGVSCLHLSSHFHTDWEILKELKNDHLMMIICKTTCYYLF